MNEDTPNKEGRSPDFLWLVSCVLITATATFLRFYWLALKPLHHDEGVNGWFLTNLLRDGTYKYDPANYHGPTLYYISLGFVEAFGLETETIRASVAIWGVLIVIFAFYLRPYIGKVGSLFAALFLALSPGLVYISRYFIHEMFFVFLSFGIVLSMVYFIEKKRAGILAIAWTVLILLVCFLPSTLRLSSALARDSQTALWAFRGGFFLVELVLIGLVVRMLLTWNDGRPIHFLLAIACVALMFATKETAFITVGTMLIACGCVWLWRKVFKIRDAEVAEPNSELDTSSTDVGIDPDDRQLNWANFREGLGSSTDRLLLTVASVAVFAYITVLFFSSFLTYFEGVKGFVEAYAIWTKTGSKDHTQNGIWAYVTWGLESEAPILLLAGLGGLVAFVKARHRLAMFITLWAFGLFLAYTIIPYKTPWLAISFMVPMCIVAGYAIGQLAIAKNPSLKILAGLFAVTGSVVLAYQAYDLNFVHYDDEDRALIYAHTSREFEAMVREIEYLADKSGRGTDAKIQVVSPDYWPMVWYMRNYKQANFHGTLVDAADAEMIVGKTSDQDQELIRRYSARYVVVPWKYHLRSGVDLVLLVRRDIADSDARELYRIPELPRHGESD